MSRKRNVALLCIILIIASLSTCGSTMVKDKREENILRLYSNTNESKYAGLLVNIESYTSNGRIYHQKYQKYLIGIAGEITENKKLRVMKGSIGFYFDKKSDSRNKLYLGLDIDSTSAPDEDYARTASMLLKKDLRTLIEVINSCRTVFDEDEVVGLVFGWSWMSLGSREQVNIWMNKKDALRFEENRLTFEELVDMSTITNSSGKFIRLRV